MVGVPRSGDTQKDQNGTIQSHPIFVRKAADTINKKLAALAAKGGACSLPSGKGNCVTGKTELWLRDGNRLPAEQMRGGEEIVTDREALPQERQPRVWLGWRLGFALALGEGDELTGTLLRSAEWARAAARLPAGIPRVSAPESSRRSRLSAVIRKWLPFGHP